MDIDTKNYKSSLCLKNIDNWSVTFISVLYNKNKDMFSLSEENFAIFIFFSVEKY
jgi:hypothetical protein